jgi:site-specific recombinase XerD
MGAAGHRPLTFSVTRRDTPRNENDRFARLRRFAERTGTAQFQAFSMPTGFDADVIAYATWARGTRGLSANTVRVRTDFLQRVHVFLGHPLRHAQPGQLLRFEQLAIAGRAAESRRAYVCHLRAFYRWLLQTGVITNDPTTMLTLPRVPKHLPRPIEEDDLFFVLSAAKPKMRAMLTIAAFAGLRCCEIAGLEWSDLRREPDGSAFLLVRQAKGSKHRTVEIGDTVVKALQAYGIKRKGPMFLGVDGRQIAPGSVSRSINRYLRQHGISATAHQLRHRYGTVAYQLSKDLRMVQEQLGHASPNTTAGYARPSAEAAARMVAQMDQMSRTRRQTLPT